MSKSIVKPVIAVSLGYPVLMAILWLSTSHPYSDAHLILQDRWWFLAVLATLTLYFAKSQNIPLHRSSRLGGISWLVIIPVILSALGGAVTLVQPQTLWNVAALAILGTLFVGIGEEIAYRGIIFQQFATRLSINASVLISSILFGLMHSVNVIGQSQSDTVTQVVITTIIGSAFAWTYVSSRGNIVLVIILHWLYDAALIAPQASVLGSNDFAGSAAILLLIGALIMNVHGLIKYRGRIWNSVI